MTNQAGNGSGNTSPSTSGNQQTFIAGSKPAVSAKMPKEFIKLLEIMTKFV